MHTDPAHLSVLAHRGCLTGIDHRHENSILALQRATAQGFDVEFDINFDPERTQLVLSHDEACWSKAHDALTFLRNPGRDSFHALNIKNLYTLWPILHAIQQAETQKSFFLFDFELVADDLRACQFLMHALSEAGFSIAYRLSDREPYFDAYRDDAHISHLWLDEFETPWVTEAHIAALKERGKQTFYVSPDLHGSREMDALKQRWEQMIAWGVSGICTDYPVCLSQLLGGSR